MCSVQLKSRISVKPRKPNNVIHKTTSETIRLENPETLLNNNTIDGMTAISPINKKAQSPTSSFQITGVSVTQPPDCAEDSADESHTDDISRITDNETPSFSEDTCSRDAEDNLNGSVPYVSTASELFASSPRLANINSHNSESHKTTTVVTTISSTSETNSVAITTPSRFPGTRFKVVKIESHEPFKRGRWTCMDYLDNSIDIPKTSIACNIPCTPHYTIAGNNKLVSDSITLKNKFVKLETLESNLVYSLYKSNKTTTESDALNGNDQIRVSHNVQYSGQARNINSITNTRTEPSTFMKNERKNNAEPHCDIATLSSAFSLHQVDSIDAKIKHSSNMPSRATLPSITSYKNDVNDHIVHTSNLTANLATNRSCSAFANESILSQNDFYSFVTAASSLRNSNEVNRLSNVTPSQIPTNNPFSSFSLLDDKFLNMTDVFQKLADSGALFHQNFAFLGPRTNPTVIIDSKIEQALDLVKDHIMYMVRDEVDLLKKRISELVIRVNQLEEENHFLKENASQQTLNTLYLYQRAQQRPPQLRNVATSAASSPGPSPNTR